MALLASLGHQVRLLSVLPVIVACVVASLFAPLLEVFVGPPKPLDADLRGKTALVTGATSGVGLATATRLARMGATVYVAGRDVGRTAAAVAAVEKAAPGRAVAARLDLLSLASVRACASGAPRLDILVLNAGVNANTPTYGHPELDCSLCFGVNFVAHWLLLTLLLPKLEATARVVCLSSVTHHKAVPDWSGAPDYAESKLAMVLLARALSRGEFGGRRVTGVAVNPGAVNSGIWRHVHRPIKPAFDAIAGLLFLTPDQGSATSVAAAAAEPAPPLGADGLPRYLAPYWQPALGPGRYGMEFSSVFAGSAPCFARLPRDERGSAAALFAECARLVAGRP